MTLAFAILLNLIASYGNHLTITIFDVANLEAEDGGSQAAAEAGHWIAMQHVNNDTDLLPNITFNLKVYDSKYDTQTCITETLDIMEFESNETHIYFPIVLGHELSAFSVIMNPILATFNKGQISASASSISLSNKNKYPYFYR